MRFNLSRHRCAALGERAGRAGWAGLVANASTFFLGGRRRRPPRENIQCAIVTDPSASGSTLLGSVVANAWPTFEQASRSWEVDAAACCKFDFHRRPQSQGRDGYATNLCRGSWPATPH